MGTLVCRTRVATLDSCLGYPQHSVSSSNLKITSYTTSKQTSIIQSAFRLWINYLVHGLLQKWAAEKLRRITTMAREPHSTGVFFPWSQNSEQMSPISHGTWRWTKRPWIRNYVTFKFDVNDSTVPVGLNGCNAKNGKCLVKLLVHGNVQLENMWFKWFMICHISAYHTPVELILVYAWFTGWG